MFQSILVPLDGSEHSQMALRVACKLTPPTGARVILLHVPEPLEHEPLLVWGIGAIPMGSTTEQREKAGQSLLDKASEEARSHGLDSDAITTKLAHGDPRQLILATAKEQNVDAIVMGSRGLSELKGLIVGSIAHRVSHAANCRVVTVY
ncbi:universal stress protein [Halomonas eurihalina]|uniref:Universal stress protein n=1 Tax=Halomonas eurihalina TaxID=42566 RepID=A0A5D9CYE6_HALER|nr:universal stress protein [Halomonas eurihalina]MDR5861126.1 universal stress protein [Halomonas eurihalina]TZG35481.1 universal stress protein [Halomonas eurihalina]